MQKKLQRNICALLIGAILVSNHAVLADDGEGPDEDAVGPADDDMMDDGGEYDGEDYGGEGPNGDPLSESIEGVIELDEYTLPKVLPATGLSTVLIVYMSYDESQVTLGSGLAQAMGDGFKDKTSLLVSKAEGSKVKEILAPWGFVDPNDASSEVSEDDESEATVWDPYPVVFFWPASAKKGDKPLNVTGEIDLAKDEGFAEWLAKIVGGPGSVEALMPLAKQFRDSTPGAKAAIAEKAKAMAAAFGEGAPATAAYYSKAMLKAIEKGDSYINTEWQRLSKMVKGGSLREEKAKEFKLRLDVLAELTNDQLAYVPEEGTYEL